MLFSNYDELIMAINNNYKICKHDIEVKKRDTRNVYSMMPFYKV
jgi:hypothetical protein